MGKQPVEGTYPTGLSTRRGILKIAGVAAAGAAGVAALRSVPASAGGSGNAIVMVAPLRIVDTRNGHGPLSSGFDYVFGPFPVTGVGFDSGNYYGMMANMTATAWTSSGWLSIRANGTTLPSPPVSNVNFSGSVPAIPNFVITQFGTGTIAAGKVSDGKIIVHCEGPSAVHVVIDLFAYLGPDQ